MTATATAAAPRMDLKRAGQDASVWHLTDRDECIAAVEAIVTALPAGATVSVNSIRAELDAASIPDKARAGLIRIMCARGHLVLAWGTYRGIEIPVTEPSTGESAHGATVRVYERPTAHPEGR